MPGIQDGFDIVDSIRTGSNITAQTGGITGTILSVLRFALSLAAVVALVVLVIGGLMYILSFGDEDASKRAKRLIFNTIIGLIIIGASVLIVNGIIAFVFRAGT